MFVLLVSSVGSPGDVGKNGTLSTHFLSVVLNTLECEFLVVVECGVPVCDCLLGWVRGLVFSVSIFDHPGVPLNFSYPF